MQGCVSGVMRMTGEDFVSFVNSSSKELYKQTYHQVFNRLIRLKYIMFDIFWLGKARKSSIYQAFVLARIDVRYVCMHSSRSGSHDWLACHRHSAFVWSAGFLSFWSPWNWLWQRKWNLLCEGSLTLSRVSEIYKNLLFSRAARLWKAANLFSFFQTSTYRINFESHSGVCSLGGNAASSGERCVEEMWSQNITLLFYKAPLRKMDDRSASAAQCQGFRTCQHWETFTWVHYGLLI